MFVCTGGKIHKDKLLHQKGVTNENLNNFTDSVTGL